MATVTAEQHIAADPLSTALLLTSHDALRLWPGLELGESTPSGQTAVIAVGRRGEDVVIAALPPRRTPTSFVAGFRVVGGSFQTTEGAVTLDYAPGGTLARIVLDGPRDDLDAPARRFLGQLARRAESRSSAA
jgi:hypothetical protein